MKKRDWYRLLILVLFVAIPAVTLADGPDDPNDAPIDGGLSLLLAAGAAYGVKKYRDGRKKTDEPEVK